MDLDHLAAIDQHAHNLARPDLVPSFPSSKLFLKQFNFKNNKTYWPNQKGQMSSLLTPILFSLPFPFSLPFVTKIIIFNVYYRLLI